MENKSKYPIGGYAPGNYIGTCSTCKAEFIGDKRAVQCELCAIKMVEEQTQSIIDNDREVAEKEEESLYDYGWCKGNVILPKEGACDNCNNDVCCCIIKPQETLEDYILASKVHDELTSSDGSYADFHLKSELLLQGAELGAKWQKEQICNSEVLQKIRASKSDAEARRIIRTL